MCGLVGVYSSNLFIKHKDCLETLLFLDTLRGRDSTGVAAIRQNADTAILKATVPGFEFVEGPRLFDHLRLNDFCWIGHNRYGTVGKNLRSNAHPFEVLDEDGRCLLVGAHNGTLKNKHVLANHASFGTDSEALFNHIAHHGLEETLPLIEGAWALSYYDHVEEELRFIRNKERSLFYAFEEGKKTLIWASESWMIRVACNRAGIKIQDDNIFSFAEDTLYRFPAPEHTNDALTYERKGGLVGKTPPFFRGFDRERWLGGNHGASPPGHVTKTTPQTRTQAQTGTSPTAVAANLPAVTLPTTPSPSGTTESEAGERLHPKNESSSNQSNGTEPDKVTPISTAKRFKGYNGKFLSRKEIDDQLANGCSWCEETFISVEDKFAWIDRAKPVCWKCLEGEVKPDEHEGCVDASSVTFH